MLPDRNWVLVLGSAGAILAAVHAYTFRVIIDASGNPEDMRARLTYFAANQSLFIAWLFAAIAMWIVLVALLPAIWRAIGRGWAATVVVVLLFAGAAINLAGDGAQFSTLFLSRSYAGGAESLRPGLEAAASEVSSAASTLLMPGIIPFFLGSLAAAVVAAIRRPPAGRWYGLLFLLFALSNVPVGPPLIGAVLNLLFFGAIAYLTARGLAREGRPAVA
ncbi:MAG: hypothetical protein AABM32_09210 [Chloroflexota bacterium]